MRTDHITIGAEKSDAGSINLLLAEHSKRSIRSGYESHSIPYYTHTSVQRDPAPYRAATSEPQPFINQDAHLQVHGLRHAMSAHSTDWMYLTCAEACLGLILPLESS